MVKRQADAQEAIDIWREHNPLRLWRNKQPPEGWKCAVLARQLGVSHTAVGMWEAGRRLPLIDAFERIEELTGISSKEWMEWYRQKPSEDRS